MPEGITYVLPLAGLCLAAAAILAALLIILDPVYSFRVVTFAIRIWEWLKTEGRTLYAVIVGDEGFLRKRSLEAIRKAGRG